jgi:hypothetical protein
VKETKVTDSACALAVFMPGDDPRAALTARRASRLARSGEGRL